MVDTHSSFLSSLAPQQPATPFRRAKAQQIAREQKRDYTVSVLILMSKQITRFAHPSRASSTATFTPPEAYIVPMKPPDRSVESNAMRNMRQ